MVMEPVSLYTQAKQVSLRDSYCEIVLQLHAL
jgi:hypothetical protein